jgi:hypothetical protein
MHHAGCHQSVFFPVRPTRVGTPGGASDWLYGPYRLSRGPYRLSRGPYRVSRGPYWLSSTGASYHTPYEGSCVTPGCRVSDWLYGPYRLSSTGCVLTHNNNVVKSVPTLPAACTRANVIITITGAAMTPRCSCDNSHFVKAKA